MKLYGFGPTRSLRALGERRLTHVVRCSDRAYCRGPSPTTAMIGP
jgi:hypothetical protein